MTRLRMICSALVTACLAWAAPAMAAFPDRPVTLIVPYPPGAGTDGIARALAVALGNEWKQTVLVQNISGADGMIGSQHVLKQPHDGYTMLFQIPQMLLWRWTMPKANVEILKDFKLVSKIQQTPMAVVVPLGNPANTMQELVGTCKNSGEVPCSVGTATTMGELIGKQLMSAAEVKKAIFIPYRGGSPMMTDVLGNHVTLGLPSGAAALGQRKNNALKVLAVTSPQRFELMKDVPTLKEMGYDVEMVTWYGLMVPKDTPKGAFDSIVQAVNKVSTDQTLLETIRTGGAEPVFGGPQQFTQDVERELKVLGPLIQRFPSDR